MFTIKLADLVISIDNKYNYVKNLCTDYITTECESNFFISANCNEIIAEQTGNFDLSYLESLAIYRKIAEKILDYDGFLIHGVLIEYQDRGVLICAKSGVGKSTHALLWCKLFGKDCKIVNGDKPFVRITKNGIIAYGTPWAGKEGLNINKSIKITDICFLERSIENKVEIFKDDIIKSLFTQIYIPEHNKMVKFLELIDLFVRNTRQWKIYCNKDISAARTVKNALWN